MQILKYYWRPDPLLPVPLLRALETGLEMALQTSENKLDAALLKSLLTQGFVANARNLIMPSRRFEDDIRLSVGDDDVSIEVENDGNRLEFDLLKMMSFAESIPEKSSSLGLLIVPANKKLKTLLSLAMVRSGFGTI